MTRRWIAATAGLFAILAVLTACTTKVEPGTVSGSSGQQSAAPANKQLTFGQEYTATGITFSLGAPEPFHPSSSAAGSKLPRAVKMAFKLTNNTDKPLPGMGVTIQGTAAGQQVEQIFDTAQDVGNTPTVDILPGKSISWTVGFSVPAEQTELAVQVSPSLSFADNKVYYVGTV